MLSREIERIIRENKKFTDMLEEYDRTGKFPLDKIRRSFTIRRITINKLKGMSRQSGKSMSDIIDKLVEEK